MFIFVRQMRRGRGSAKRSRAHNPDDKFNSVTKLTYLA